MGLFDGVKEAFAAPARTTIIDAERETPIDRWMGWSVTKDKDTDANAIMTPQARTYTIVRRKYEFLIMCRNDSIEKILYSRTYFLFF
jgi:hypothetical protein